MEQRKLRVGFVSNFPLLKTGLGRNVKEILPVLYKTNKYELFFLAQGLSENDPNFQRFPFKIEGAMKNFNQQRFSQDPMYQRMVAYGNEAVEDFVVKNKLDCLVLSDDIWAFSNEMYLNKDWFNHIKQNIFPIITADSEPLLPQIVEWATKCPNMRFWSSFASRILKARDIGKYKHCDTIYGAINTNIFRPLTLEKKLELRKKFNIQNDEKIIIYLGRNQLRKIYASHIEGLAKFRKKYPNKKVRLLFHCNWSEPGGWPLNQIREEHGLKKEDVLTTYYCRNCADWNIQPYEGEDLDCPLCKAQKSRITAGITSSINEEDLNKIYNIADGSASIFTSGSFEFTNAESMLAGIPLAVPNYVCGEDFLNSGYVYEIKGNYTWEHQTGFKKFVPDTDSICEFFNYIYELSDNKRKEICENSRKWAIEQFDTNNIVKKYEKFLDACQPIDWEPYLNRRKEIKNVNAQIENKQTDVEFIDHCYKTILNMNLPEMDGGKQHWLRFLSQNIDKNKLRQEMVNCFRNAGAEHNKKIQPQIPFESILDKNDKSRILLVLKESIGDLFILTSLIPEIQKKYPESQIYIGCEEKYFDIFDNLPYNIKLLRWMPEFDNELQMVGFGQHKGYFNHYINIAISTQKILNYISNKY